MTYQRDFNITLKARLASYMAGAHSRAGRAMALPLFPGSLYHYFTPSALQVVSQASLWPSLASQPLFLRRGARGGGREKESGDLSQHFVFSARMWVEPMRLQQSHDFHSVIQRDSACDCHRCKAQLGYPRLCPKQELAVKNSFSGRDVLVSLLTGTGKLPCYYVYTAEGFSLAHLSTVTTLQSFASLLQLASQSHI